MMGTTSSITMPAVGAEMWCFFCHARVRSAVRSRGASFALRCRLQADFDAVCSVFFGRDFSFRYATQFSYSSLGGATIFAKLRLEIAKSPKIGGKVCAHHFVWCPTVQLRYLKKILPQQFSAGTVDVHLYNIFSARRYLALTASVTIRKSSPKTARNEQVCAHQKSYRK